MFLFHNHFIYNLIAVKNVAVLSRTHVQLRCLRHDCDHSYIVLPGLIFQKELYVRDFMLSTSLVSLYSSFFHFLSKIISLSSFSIPLNTLNLEMSRLVDIEMMKRISKQPPSPKQRQKRKGFSNTQQSIVFNEWYICVSHH